jgi:8-oxo-dGTP pyrophosphatase MutT (NUDIX family)
MTESKDVLFENCKALSKDGAFMFYCSRKKANSYVKKGLASIISEEPLVFQLNFDTEGKGRPYEEHRIKRNECVKCGKTYELSKHHIVPFMYRKKFELEHKDNRHEDIVPLCRSCHDLYERDATLLKNFIRSRYRKEDAENLRIAKVKKARKIISMGYPIPDERLRSIRSIASERIGKEVDVIQKIIDDFTQSGLSRLWRRHFSRWMKRRLVSKDEKRLLDLTTKENMRTTCGIYLLDTEGKVLISHPTGHAATLWSIPKGVPDEGEEDLFRVAIREMREETGIDLDKHEYVVLQDFGFQVYPKNPKKRLRSWLVQLKDKVNETLVCESMVVWEGRPPFPEMDDWKWASKEEARELLHDSQKLNIDQI